LPTSTLRSWKVSVLLYAATVSFSDKIFDEIEQSQLERRRDLTPSSRDGDGGSKCQHPACAPQSSRMLAVSLVAA
jgi:hypothetical protein